MVAIPWHQDYINFYKQGGGGSPPSHKYSYNNNNYSYLPGYNIMLRTCTLGCEGTDIAATAYVFLILFWPLYCNIGLVLLARPDGPS